MLLFLYTLYCQSSIIVHLHGNNFRYPNSAGIPRPWTKRYGKGSFKVVELFTKCNPKHRIIWPVCNIHIYPVWRDNAATLLVREIAYIPSLCPYFAGVIFWGFFSFSLIVSSSCSLSDVCVFPVSVFVCVKYNPLFFHLLSYMLLLIKWSPFF